MTGFASAIRFVALRCATALVAVGVVAGARAFDPSDAPQARFVAPLSSLSPSGDLPGVKPADTPPAN